ncbi:DASH family cryptochrome [Alteromonas sp. CYL-A6]|uniref:DASH family cryptochrome n=1 Tax=Alteromonas nitratireducens TaxID=3390813 RepID=UPI0034BD1F6D
MSNTDKKSAKQTGLLWFRHDLRLDDNPALRALINNVETLLCVYIEDPAWYDQNEFGLRHLGAHRQRFMQQTLASLDQALSEHGQRLHVLRGSYQTLLPELIEHHKITTVAVNTHCGVYERDAENWLVTTFPELTLISTESSCLYRQDSLPFSPDTMPAVYTPFRKKVEKFATVRQVESPPGQLPPPPDSVAEPAVFQPEADNAGFVGGESNAIAHVQAYFSGTLPAHYKETRNALDNWDHSTKFSPWLANGCISPARIWQYIDDYERMVVSNDSTYWIRFELLWREFFHWSLHHHGARFFAFSGIQGVRPATRFNEDTFTAWCNGDTGYAIVDACMRQLNATGYMSNRGRQLVASCLVHELQLDWRYGAAYFEQQLIDFDVASNWGNWMYLAGVGSDPRGHRQFNLQKQTDMYDPAGEFRDTWL